MATIHHFAYGWVTPVLAYLLSVLGSLLGLIATARARETRDRRRRARWLVLAAWAIGGTGIWVMHFMAIIGVTIDGTAVRYDVTITVASWLTAVIVVGVGLFLVGYGPRSSVPRVLGGGLITGVGVAAMHYSGVSAMRMHGSIGYDKNLVVLSVVIAVVAATAALWFTLVARRPVWIGVAAVIMGVAVTGMHYTGMSAMRIHLHDSQQEISGADALTFLVPIMIFVLSVVIALFYAILATTSESDNVLQDEMRARFGESPRLPGSSPAGPGIRVRTR